MLHPVAATSTNSGGGGGFGLLLLVVLAALFYLFLIRPQQRRRRAAQSMQSRLEPGTEVMTTSGIYATVVELTDSEVLLEVADGVTLRFAKAAVSRVVTPAGAVDEDEDEVAGDPASDQVVDLTTPQGGESLPDDRPRA